MPQLIAERSFSFTVSSVPQVKPPSINGISFGAKKLTIAGQNLTPNPQIEINGKLIENNRVSSQSETQIVLSGNRKKLALKLGTNLISVIVNGVRSTPFNLSIN
jgi:IPT/TIG domain